MFRSGTKNRSIKNRTRRMRMEPLEKRQVMTAYINEVMYDPFDGSTSNGQYIELRGEPSAKIDAGTYLLVISDDNRGSTDPGRVVGKFDLSGIEWGSNGFLVILPQNSPYSLGSGLVDGGPAPTVLQSTAPGFGGLPGNIYTDNVPGSSNELSFISSSVSFLLIQSDVAPKLGDDIDSDNNGTIDVGSVANDWNVYDSISIHDSIFTGSVAYGKVAFIEKFIDTDPPVSTPPGTNVIYTDGFGYAARIGDSTGYSKTDWVAGTVRKPTIGQNSKYYRFENGIFGVPDPYSFTGRELDHLGESNFFGGVRGKITETLVTATGPEVTPVAGVRFLADTNGNGKRDLLSYSYDPDSFAANEEITNAFPGVTLTTVNKSGRNVGYEVEADFESGLGAVNKVFSPLAFNFVPDDFRLRIDFAAPVRSVSIDAIGRFDSLASYGYLEAFNAQGQSLGFVLSKPLFGTGVQQTLKLNFSSDVVAYALAYTPSSSPAFTSFDDLKFTQSEFVAETNANGDFEFPRLLPDDYTIVPLTNSEALLSDPIPSTPISIKHYENFRLDFSTQLNSPPVLTSASFTIPEDALVDTSIGKVEASDIDLTQTISFSVQDEQKSPVRIDSTTGELFVKAPSLLDFETNRSVSFKVIATDSVGGSSSREFFLTLTDVNEAPVIDPANFEVSEEATQGAAIGRVFAFDPESPSVDPLFEIEGGTGADDFQIDPATGVITVKAAGRIDFESAKSVTLDVKVSDRSTPPLSSRATVTVSLVNANDTPKILTDKLEVLESLQVGKSLGFINATDQDTDQSFFFRIVEGAGTTFKINEQTGELLLTAPLNYEAKSVYELQIQVVDNGAPPRATVKTVKVQVGDVDEPATLKVNEFSVAENSAAESVIATLEVVDPEKATGFTFVSTDATKPTSLFGGLVKLDQSTGKLSVAPGAILDAEKGAEISDRLIIRRGADVAGEVTITLNLQDVNEAPTIVSSSVEFPKNFPSGRGFVVIKAEDPEQDEMTFEVIGEAAEKFTVLSSNELAVKAGVELDFETTPQHQVTIKVTDSHGKASTKEITVTQGALPRVGTTIPNLTVPVGAPYLFQLPFRFRNPNVSSISMIGGGPGGELPKGLRFDATTGRIIGTALPSAASNSRVKVQLSELDGDDVITKEEEFELAVERSDKPLLNPTNAFDVDANGRVNPLDALRIINFLAKKGTGGDANQLADTADGFYDCNGNNVITALDALLIINSLRRTAPSSSSTSSSSGATSGTSSTPAVASGEMARIAAPDPKNQSVDQAMTDWSQGSLF